MSIIILQMASHTTPRNAAFNAIADEIGAGFNAVKAGSGDRIIAEATAQFPSTPISFGINIEEFAPAQSGKAYFTIVWGALIDDSEVIYGYYVDFLMDLAATTVTVQQFKTAVRNRWDGLSSSNITLSDFKIARRLARRLADGLPDDSATEYSTTVSNGIHFKDDIEYPQHRFAVRSIIVEE